MGESERFCIKDDIAISDGERLNPATLVFMPQIKNTSKTFKQNKG